MVDLQTGLAGGAFVLGGVAAMAVPAPGARVIGLGLVGVGLFQLSRTGASSGDPRVQLEPGGGLPPVPPAFPPVAGPDVVIPTLSLLGASFVSPQDGETVNGRGGVPGIPGDNVLLDVAVRLRNHAKRDWKGTIRLRTEERFAVPFSSPFKQSLVKTETIPALTQKDLVLLIKLSQGFSVLGQSRVSADLVAEEGTGSRVLTSVSFLVIR